MAQLLHERPDLKVESVRGNVDTRLRKLDEGQYDALMLATGLSRAKIAGGLDVLERNGIIERKVEKRRSTYKLIGYDRIGWGMLPARRLYSMGGQIVFLRDFHLRKIA